MGPLADIRVLELGGIGPNPFAGMLMADLGADVIRIDRSPGGGFGQSGESDPTMRGRQTIAVDLKRAPGLELALALSDRADVLIEGFRPGVMERLGLGPEELLARNQRLVYGRVTGYGQSGPMAASAGHDINYISVSGALGASRRVGERPMFPVNLLGDYGGGALFLALGVVSALLHARTYGVGQVVDAAMVDGSALLTTVIHGMRAGGDWNVEPGTNLLDSGAHFYEVYETSDGEFVAVGALEPQFYDRLLILLGLSEAEMPQWDQSRWPEFKRRLAEVFATRTASDWASALDGEDTCATVVRGPFEAPLDPHLRARETFVSLDGVVQPAPAPRFSGTPTTAMPAQHDPGAALARWGLDPEVFAEGLASAGPPV